MTFATGTVNDTWTIDRQCAGGGPHPDAPCRITPILDEYRETTPLLECRSHLHTVGWISWAPRD